MSAYLIKLSEEFTDAWDVEEISDDHVSLATDHHLVARTDRALERLFWELASFISENLPERKS